MYCYLSSTCDDVSWSRYFVAGEMDGGSQGSWHGSPSQGIMLGKHRTAGVRGCVRVSVAPSTRELLGGGRDVHISAASGRPGTRHRSQERHAVERVLLDRWGRAGGLWRRSVGANRTP